MGSRRQQTLLETWGQGQGQGQIDDNNRPGPSRTSAMPGDVPFNAKPSRGWSAAKIPRPRGRGRGGTRGRGRGKRGTNSTADSNNRGNLPPSNIPGFEDDDDDNICEMALSNFELTTNDISKAFEDLNAAAELPGFDKTAGDIWIYPTNKPVRDYQFDIVQTALYNNTLVSLPTGLGKTFIAAVVMFNFHRWYPNNLIIFMAPTRPLVTQQLDACHNVMGIAPSKMMELTGQIIPKKRELLWKEKTVFFLTPQVLASDLERGYCPADLVRCIVVDEAHKAQGNHAFVQVITWLSNRSKHFRVLALSATPGSDITAVQEVLKNLTISKVELRSESSPDILPYTHQKQVDKIIVPLDDNLNSVVNQLTEVFQQYTGKLMKLNVLFGRDGSSFTQFQLLKGRQSYRENPPTSISNYQRGYIENDFATCITIAHAMELLVMHGLRSFYSFLNGVVNKKKGSPSVAAELRRHSNVEEILSGVQSKLNISLENSKCDSFDDDGLLTSFLKNTTIPDPNEDEDFLVSHPKMKILKDLILTHFKKCQSNSQSTRVMVFSQYRDSVQEIGNMLNSFRPLVKPMVFIGQGGGKSGGRGLKQKDQAQILQGFRDGQFNVLVSTCVGEEGLDIGEVDLIICFDANKSPTRLVQRMGRTGRQRQGKTIFLLTKGREEGMYAQSLHKQTTINKTIVDARQLQPFLYKYSPRMVPSGVAPQCYKMEIILSSEQKQIQKNKDGNSGGLSNAESYQYTEDVDFANPLRPIAKKDQGRKNRAERQADQNTVVTTSSSNSENQNSERTRQLLLSTKNGNELCIIKSTAEVDAEPEVAILDDRAEDMECLVLEDALPDLKIDEDFSSDYNLICDIFGVKNNDKSSTAQCIFIPKLQEPTKWRPEYNAIDRSSILINAYDLQCIKEKLSATYMVGPTSDRCACGLPVADYFLFNMDDMDMESDNEHLNKSDILINCSTPKRAPSPIVFEDNVSDSSLTDFSPPSPVLKFGTPKRKSQATGTVSEKKFNFKENPSFKRNAGNFTAPSFGSEPFLESKTASLPEILSKTAVSSMPLLNSLQNSVFTPRPTKTPSPCRMEVAEDKIYFCPESPDMFESYHSPVRPSSSKEKVCRDLINGFTEDEKEVIGSDDSTCDEQDILALAPWNFSPTPPSTSFGTPKRKLTMEKTVAGKKFSFSPTPPSIAFETPKREFTMEKTVAGKNFSFSRTPPSIAFETPKREFTMEKTVAGKKFSFKENPSIKRNQGNFAIPNFSSEQVLESRIASPSERFQIPRSSTPRSSPQIPPIVRSPSYFTIPNFSSVAVLESRVASPSERFQTPRSSTPRSSPQIPLIVRNPSYFTISSVPIIESRIDSPSERFQTPRSSPQISPYSTRTTPFNLSYSEQVDFKETSDYCDRDSPDIFESPSPIRAPSRRPKKRRRRVQANVFVRDEAEVSGGDDSTADENDDLSDSDLDQYDSSFVTYEPLDTISESQQAHYMRSVKDIIPIPQGRIEKPLEPFEGMSTSWDNEYEADSFVVTENEVEYADVGVYTQAMICAKEELDLEEETELDGFAESMPPPRSIKCLRSRRTKYPKQSELESGTKPRRRRIITYSDEDDED